MQVQSHCVFEPDVPPEGELHMRSLSLILVLTLCTGVREGFPPEYKSTVGDEGPDETVRNSSGGLVDI